jgi:hypothetical protein
LLQIKIQGDSAKRQREGEEPLEKRPSRTAVTNVPKTLIYDYPEQLYLFTTTMGFSTESSLVKKIGNNTIKDVRTGQERILSKKEYDELRPLNPPNRFGRFDPTQPVNRRDDILRDTVFPQLLGSRATGVTGSSFLSSEDMQNLARTNSVVRDLVLESDSFLSLTMPRGYVAMLNDAVKNNNLALVRKLFNNPLRTEPILPPELSQLVYIACKYNHTDMLRLLLSMPMFRNVMSHTEEVGWYQQIISRTYEQCIHNNNLQMLRLLFGLSEPQPFNLCYSLNLAAKNGNREAVYLLSPLNPTMECDRPRPTIYYLISNFGRHSMYLINSCLRFKSPELRRIILSRSDAVYKLPIAAALKFQKYDIVNYILSLCDSPEQSTVYIRLPGFLLSLAIVQKNIDGTEIMAPLHIIKDLVTVIKRIFEFDKIDDVLNEADKALNITYPLHYCALRNSTPPDSHEVARILIEVGNAENKVDSSTGHSAFITACRHSLNPELIRVLLEYGARIHATPDDNSLKFSRYSEGPPTKYARNALWYAMFSPNNIQHPRIRNQKVRLLIEYGAETKRCILYKTEDGAAQHINILDSIKDYQDVVSEDEVADAEMFTFLIRDKGATFDNNILMLSYFLNFFTPELMATTFDVCMSRKGSDEARNNALHYFLFTILLNFDDNYVKNEATYLYRKYMFDMNYKSCILIPDQTVEDDIFLTDDVIQEIKGRIIEDELYDPMTLLQASINFMVIVLEDNFGRMAKRVLEFGKGLHTNETLRDALEEAKSVEKTLGESLKRKIQNGSDFTETEKQLATINELINLIRVEIR